MENISYHKWATTIVMNCLCRASNSRSQTPKSLDYSTAKPKPKQNKQTAALPLWRTNGKKDFRVSRLFHCTRL